MYLHSSDKNSRNFIMGMLCCAQSSVEDMGFRVKRLSGGDHQRPVANAPSFCLIQDVVWHSFDSAMSFGHVVCRGLSLEICCI